MNIDVALKHTLLTKAGVVFDIGPIHIHQCFKGQCMLQSACDHRYKWDENIPFVAQFDKLHSKQQVLEFSNSHFPMIADSLLENVKGFNKLKRHRTRKIPTAKKADDRFN